MLVRRVTNRQLGVGQVANIRNPIAASLQLGTSGVRRSSRTLSVGAKTTTTIPSAAPRRSPVMSPVGHITNGPYAIGYVRVSTEKQTDSGLGLQAQRASIREAAGRIGLDLRAVYEDAGVSGALAMADRPVLVEAVSALGRGCVLIVAKRDRLGRDGLEVAIVERSVAKRGAQIVSAAGEGGTDNDPASVLLRWIIDGFAQYERLCIKARTKGALTVKRGRGERVGNVPYGSQLAADGVHLEPAPVERRLIARILELHADGYTVRRIAEDLNRHGWTTRRGTAWRFEYVARQLRAQASV